jgi:predicted metal-binding protein
MAEQASNLGDLIKKLATAKATKEAAAAKANTADAAYREIEQAVMLQMQESGTNIARNAGLTVSLTSSKLPQVTDWEELNRFILRHKRLDLFQRRLSSETYREIAEAKKLDNLPGCTTFEKWGLRVTKGK